MISTSQALLIIAVAALGTIATRAIPFLLFGGHKTLPPSIQYLGFILPPAIIAILVVFCLRGAIPPQGWSGTAELVALATVILLHRWKSNILLSISGSTLLYMVLIRIL